MFTEKKKEQFISIHDELDVIIENIVHAKADYGKYNYKCDYYIWEYDNDVHLFEIEVTERGFNGCGDETYYMQITWEEIFDVDNIIEKLKKEAKEREIEAAEKKKKDIILAHKEDLAKERRVYERLKAKFEKS